MISVIILGAGRSERMGQTKQTLPFGTATILEKTIDNYAGSAAGEIIVVLGHQAEKIKEIIGDKSIGIVTNPDYRQGMSTSLIAGLKKIARGAAVMIALGDQPLIESRTINLLIREYERHDKGIVVPIYRGKRGHPIIFSIKYKAELLSLSGDTGAREIIGRHPSDVLEVPVDTDAICIDIDTTESYEAAMGRLKKSRTRKDEG